MLAGQIGFDTGDHRAPSEGSEQKSNLPREETGEVPQKRTGTGT